MPGKNRAIGDGLGAESAGPKPIFTAHSSSLAASLLRLANYLPMLIFE
jgi:hypothetical protein